MNASNDEGNNPATANMSSKADILQQRQLLQEEATAENEQGVLEDEAESSFDIFRDAEENAGEGLTDDYGYDYDDYFDESMWGNDTWSEAIHEQEADYISVDSHILCTPVRCSFWLSTLCILLLVFRYHLGFWLWFRLWSYGTYHHKLKTCPETTVANKQLWCVTYHEHSGLISN